MVRLLFCYTEKITGGYRIRPVFLLSLNYKFILVRGVL